MNGNVYVVERALVDDDYISGWVPEQFLSGPGAEAEAKREVERLIQEDRDACRKSLEWNDAYCSIYEKVRLSFFPSEEFESSLDDDQHWARCKMFDAELDAAKREFLSSNPEPKIPGPDYGCIKPEFEGTFEEVNHPDNRTFYRFRVMETRWVP